MIPASGRHEATFYQTDRTGKRYVDQYLPVEAWSSKGEPMIVDEKTGRLRIATSFGNFDTVVENHNSRRVAVIPGGGWLMHHTDPEGKEAGWTEPVVAWVFDEYGYGEAVASDGFGDLELVSRETNRVAFSHPDQRNQETSP